MPPQTQGTFLPIISFGFLSLLSPLPHSLLRRDVEKDEGRRAQCLCSSLIFQLNSSDFSAFVSVSTRLSLQHFIWAWSLTVSSRGCLTAPLARQGQNHRSHSTDKH